MAVSAILNFGQFSTFDHYDIEGRVIGFSRMGSPFQELCFECGVKVKVTSEVKGHI